MRGKHYNLSINDSALSFRALNLQVPGKGQEISRPAVQDTHSR
jgi:hypothetical protein